MKALDVAALTEILRRAARVEILPRFRNLKAGEIRAKSEAIDLMTDADEAAERAITAELRALHPDAVVVGEEAASADPRLLGALDDAEFAFTLDPVDGTANFAAGLPLFAVMLAAVRHGETVAGVIYDPIADDALVAEKGAGAFLLRADGTRTRQHFGAPAALGAMSGTASPFFLPEADRARVLANFAKLRLVAAYRCAGHEYRAAAAGYLNFLMYAKLMPWDHLPGVLISTEAGAHAARLDGSAYRPGHVAGGLLVAPDAESWALLQREIFTT